VLQIFPCHLAKSAAQQWIFELAKIREQLIMDSWEALDPHPLQPGGPVTAAFQSVDKPDLVAAAKYACELPHGRNSNREDPLIVLREKQGTCSTKHALLRRLAIEQGWNLSLVLGIYKMR
jgi:hypothetical protein